ncbi:hypothetical protein [Amycolatopsis australiensis]|uniref:Uncharacterized protein n=1 Tax=Amycolatopsis australiensis TaxID=546364 RepID=A0A1K1RFV8_9PSEU|nr:hypothetical protein [Amycolatopsis australiensis]SFW70944.1 hypothetical protein SAMN04489730_3195 [Amycolatopsis australiensis]
MQYPRPVTRKSPSTLVRFGHFASLSLSDGADGITIGANVGGLWFDIAGTPLPHQVPAFERAFGTERLCTAATTAGPRPRRSTPDSPPSTQHPDTSWRELTVHNSTRLFPRLGELPM